MSSFLGGLASEQRGAPVAAALVFSAAAVAVGYYAGRRAADADKRRRRDELCECGTVLPKACSAEERERHRFSNRHRKNMLQLEHASKVIVCEEVGEYRAAALQVVRPDDWVLEVGSHVGGTTKVLAGLTKNLIGVDQQSDLVAQARGNLPSVRFEVIDAFDTPKMLALAREIAPDRFKHVFIDISGSRDIATVIRLMDIFENTLRPETMLVKSQPLKRLLLRSQLWIHHPLRVGDLHL